MTLAHADDTEAAMRAPVSDDPVLALGAAERDGLLKYLGYHTDGSGEMFEIILFGRRFLIGADEVVPLVRRLRALHEVGSGVRAVSYRRDSGVFEVEVGGVRQDLAGVDVLHWCDGFQAAAAGGPQPAVGGEDNLGSIIQLLESPSLANQQRMVILGLMYGRPGVEPVSAEKLAQMAPRVRGTAGELKRAIAEQAAAASKVVELERAAAKPAPVEPAAPGGLIFVEPGAAGPVGPGAADEALLAARVELEAKTREVERIRNMVPEPQPRAKKTIVDALAFGEKTLPGSLAADLIAAFGLRWTLDGVAEPVAGGRLEEPLPQMPGLTRLKAIVRASRAGWVRYVDEPQPNEARWLKRYRLVIGETVHVVAAEELLPWLAGVESYHRYGVEPAAG